jgi:hypothetical protein
MAHVTDSPIPIYCQQLYHEQPKIPWGVIYWIDVVDSITKHFDISIDNIEQLNITEQGIMFHYLLHKSDKVVSKPKPKITLKVGKKYRTRSGNIASVFDNESDTYTYSYRGIVTGNDGDVRETWNESGLTVLNQQNDNDLIELIEEPEPANATFDGLSKEDIEFISQHSTTGFTVEQIEEFITKVGFLKSTKQYLISQKEV